MNNIIRRDIDINAAQEIVLSRASDNYNYLIIRASLFKFRVSLSLSLSPLPLYQSTRELPRALIRELILIGCKFCLFVASRKICFETRPSHAYLVGFG